MTSLLPEDRSDAMDDLGSEALFKGIIDKVGLDVVVEVLQQRRRVREEHLKGSVIDQGLTQFTVRSDRVEFVTDDGQGKDWRGDLGYDAARVVLNTYIEEKLQETPTHYEQ